MPVTDAGTTSSTMMAWVDNVSKCLSTVYTARSIHEWDILDCSGRIRHAFRSLIFETSRIFYQGHLSCRNKKNLHWLRLRPDDLGLPRSNNPKNDDNDYYDHNDSK